MANVELSQSEYQKLLDDATELRSTRKELDSLKTEMENKNKAIVDEREQRRKLSEKIKELESTLDTKDKELEDVKTEYADFDVIKENAEKWKQYEESKNNEIQDKIKTLTNEVGEEVLEKHKKFIENMSDELKIEYIENLKQSSTPESFSNNPGEGQIKPVTPPNNRLTELRTKKEAHGLSPSEKIEFLTLVSKSESE